MKAVILKEFGKPEVGEHQTPTANDGQKVVKVSVAGIGVADRIYASGLVPSAAFKLSSVIGMEGVGLVDGKRVYFDNTISPFGAFGEQALIEASSAINIPDEITDEQAITLGLSGSTAWTALSWRAKVQPGDNVLILGATGAVGKMAIQIAKLLGAGRVIAAARPGDALEATKELGADATVGLVGDVGAMAAKMGEASQGKVDVILDLLWGQPAVAALLVASFNARFVAVGIEAGMEVNLSSAILMTPQTNIMGLSMRTVPNEVKSEAFAALANYARKGKLKLSTKVYPLADFKAAWERAGQAPYVKVLIDLKKSKGENHV